MIRLRFLTGQLEEQGPCVLKKSNCKELRTFRLDVKIPTGVPSGQLDVCVCLGLEYLAIVKVNSPS